MNTTYLQEITYLTFDDIAFLRELAGAIGARCDNQHLSTDECRCFEDDMPRLRDICDRLEKFIRQ